MVRFLFVFTFLLESAFGASIILDLGGLKKNNDQTVNPDKNVVFVENRLNSESVLQVFKNNTLLKTIVLKAGESRSVKLQKKNKERFHVIGVKPPTVSVEF